jgi:aspartyl-tRNA(Asn)/glutamyl-tRNA(Gln) amidotransferase subunit B
MPSAPAIASTRLVIGMEIHVELATRSKMFTRAANVAHPDHYDAEPNALVDPLVAALPGTLPVMNRRAVELSMMVGLALGCRIPAFCKWDRKNYFYPDLPKGYQISQYDLPLCVEGHLEFESDLGGTRSVRIIRAHLEEDAGKLGHELPGGLPYEGSLVDLNRAGTPLLEIVTEPDLASADDAVTFARELRAICRFLGVSECIMQRGHMRFEPNINVIITTDDGLDHTTPIVEVKNLNSFRALKGAIEHEHERQVEAWREDGVEHATGLKSTRGWDDARGVTVLQREKEEAHDYRYFPEPDLPPVVISDTWREDVAAQIPELPMQRRARYVAEYGLQHVDAVALTEAPALCALYESCIAAVDADSDVSMTPADAGTACAKLLRNVGARYANERGVEIHELGITPQQIVQLIALRERDAIGSSAADDLFGLLCDSDDDAEPLAEQQGLLQVSDDAQLEAWIEGAVEAQPDAAADFAAGKDAAVGRLIGAVMKLSGGRADAKAVRGRLHARLRGDS